MAIIKTFPLKSTYYGGDRFLISDMQPDSNGDVSGSTKNITFSTLKSLIGGGSGSGAVSSVVASGTFGTVTPTTGDVKIGYSITGLTDAISSTVRTDLLLVVDDPSGTPINKKISFTDMMNTSALQASDSQSGFLSSADWNTFNTAGRGGGVESVGASDPIFSSGGTSPQITMAESTDTNDGWLSSTNFESFSKKQQAITLSTDGTSGKATFVDNILNIPAYESGSGGGLKSVGLTMPSAFKVGNSPLTADGIINVGVDGGEDGQFLDYLGEWSTPKAGGLITGLTTDKTSGAATLLDGTLNIPIYETSGGVSYTSYEALFSISSLEVTLDVLSNNTGSSFTWAATEGAIRITLGAALPEKKIFVLVNGFGSKAECYFAGIVASQRIDLELRGFDGSPANVDIAQGNIEIRIY